MIGSLAARASRTVAPFRSMMRYGIPNSPSALATSRPPTPNPSTMTCPVTGVPAASASTSTRCRPGRIRSAIRGAIAVNVGAASIVKILAGRSICQRSVVSMPSRSASRPRTNENSPTCARYIAEMAATRRGVPVNASAPPATTAFTAIVASAVSATSGALRRNTDVSMSIPSEMKNRLLSRSRSGRTSACA